MSKSTAVRNLRIALTQMSCGPNPAANLKKQLALLKHATGQGAKILCTQELFRTQYFCQLEKHDFFNLAEPIPGSTTRALARLAKQHKFVIIGSVFERRAPGICHNSAVLIETDGTIAGIYRKMHIPDDPLYYEKFYFTPGDTGFRAWDTTYGRFGILICWDQWFPEAARLTALHGAQIIFYPSAIGWHASEKATFGQSQLEAWQLIQRSHALANGCFVCAANRVGLEKLTASDGTVASPEGIELWGHSFVAAPNGQITAQASGDQEEVLIADLDLEQVEFSRIHWPFLRDRRIDAYADLTRRFVDRWPDACSPTGHCLERRPNGY